MNTSNFTSAIPYDSINTNTSFIDKVFNDNHRRTNSIEGLKFSNFRDQHLRSSPQSHFANQDKHSPSNDGSGVFSFVNSSQLQVPYAGQENSIAESPTIKILDLNKTRSNEIALIDKSTNFTTTSSLMHLDQKPNKREEGVSQSYRAVQSNMRLISERSNNTQENEELGSNERQERNGGFNLGARRRVKGKLNLTGTLTTKDQNSMLQKNWDQLQAQSGEDSGEDIASSSKMIDNKGLLFVKSRYSDAKDIELGKRPEIIKILDPLVSPNCYSEHSPASSTMLLSFPSAVAPAENSETQRQKVSEAENSLADSNQNQTTAAPRVRQQRQRATLKHRILRYLNNVKDIEGKLTLIRAIEFCIMMACLCFPLMFVSSEAPIPFRSMLLTLYCFLVYTILENIISTQIPQRKSIKTQEDLFAALDAFGGLLFLTSVDLRLHRIFSSITFTPCIFGITVLLYYVLSSAAPYRKFAGILRRVVITAQAFLVVANLDMNLAWDWRVIFTISWVYLSVTATHAFVLSILLIYNNVATIIRYVRQGGPSWDDLVDEVLTCLWKLIYNELDVPTLLGAVMICSIVENEGNFDVLKITAIVSFIVCILIIGYTIFRFNLISEHIEFYHVFEILEGSDEEEEEEAIEKTPETRIELQTLEKEQYFVRVSDSYFVPLQKDLVKTNKERKTRVQKLFFSYFKSMMPQNVQSLDKKPQVDKVTNLATMRDRKDSLDRIAKADSNKDANQIVRQLPKLNLLGVASTVMTSRHSDRKGKGIFDLNALEDHGGWAISVRNHIRFTHGDRISTERDKNLPTCGDEKLCYICYENAVDAILMDCGHAGVCFDCACILIEKKNECMECRGRVDEVVRIDVKTILEDIYKGVEFKKVVVVKNVPK